MKLLFAFICLFALSCSSQRMSSGSTSSFNHEVKEVLRQQVMEKAAWALEQQPVTVTAQTSPRSAGGKHDFFSEGDYWWPNPVSADSPYIQKDGMTNPGNFVAHRHAMIRLSKIVGALFIIKCFAVIVI